MNHIKTANRATRRQAAKTLAADNTKYPAHLVVLPVFEYPSKPPAGLIRVLRSRDYLVQVIAAPEPALVRLSVNRTGLDARSDWNQNIPWEDMQRIKAECGYAGHDAVEIYPREADVVNVANMRHLWVLETPLSFAWRTA